MATQYPAVISVTSLDGTSGFTLERAVNGDGIYFGSIDSAGDINGDGLDDFIAHEAPSASDDRATISVVFGTKAGFGSTLDLASLNGRNGFAVTASYGPVRAAGDVDGDGYGDLVVGQPSDGANTGRVTLVYGKAGGFAPRQTLADLVGKDADTLYVGAADMRVGGGVASAGDVNGDGRDDLIVSTGGSGYAIVFGQAGRFATPVGTLDGKNGFTFSDGNGSALDAAGDINGDGIDDIVVGSSVVFGRKGGFDPRVDASDLDGRNGFTFGLPGGSITSASAAGDVNGDGIGDLIVGARDPDHPFDGVAYVVFGRKSGFEAQFDLDTLDGADGFKISGKGNGFSYFDQVRSAGDVNGDGYADLLVATAQYGTAYSFGDRLASVSVVFGHAGRFDATVPLASLDGRNGFRIGGLEGFRGVTVDAGDINGDGAVDILIGNANLAGSEIAGFVIYGDHSFAGVTRDGSRFDDVLTGTVNGDRLNGFRGNDTLIGGAGDDRLNGGQGADRMEGGTGDDTYVVDDHGDWVVEARDQGRDTVLALVDYSLAAGQHVEELRAADAAARSNLKLTGNEAKNLIIGNAGDNLITSGGGADNLYGGKGDDVYAVRAGDRVFEAADEGNDLVVATTSFTLGYGASVETLQLAGSTGTARLNLTGNEYAQVIRGNGGNNLLDGNATGHGSRSADSLYGKRGDDTYVVRTSGDKVYEAAGEGNDTVISYVSYALAAGQEVENLQFHSSTRWKALDLTGNAFTNTIYGNASANKLDGGLGSDVLTGNGGADSFVFSTELGPSNVDHITDFAPEDTIRLAKGIFTALGAGPLAESAFKNISLAKTDADDRILYKQATGELFYDTDGSGAARATLFAVLDNKAMLTAADFLVV